MYLEFELERRLLGHERALKTFLGSRGTLWEPWFSGSGHAAKRPLNFGGSRHGEVHREPLLRGSSIRAKGRVGPTRTRRARRRLPWREAAGGSTIERAIGGRKRPRRRAANL